MKKATSDVLVVESLRIFYNAAKAHKRELQLALLGPVGAVFMSVAVPFFAGRVFAGLAEHSPKLHEYLTLLAISSIAGIITNRIGFNKLMVLLARSMADLHNLVFSRLLMRSVGFHADNISGKLISDETEFVAAYNTLMMAIFNTALSFLSIILVGVVIVFINSWQLGVFLSFTVIVTIVWAYFESRKRSALRSKRLIASKRLTAHLSDSIVNAQTVKTFAAESFELKENTTLNGALRDLRVRDWQRAGRSGNDRVSALLFMQFCMILLLVHLSHTDPNILATGIFAFTYTFTLTNRLFDLNNLTRQIEDSFLEASPITKMLLETVEISDAKGAKPLEVDKGAIEVNKISFAYKERSNKQLTVFTDFSLHVAPGEKVGLVGPSGGGKSTLTRLLLRFDEVQKGEILIDGQRINNVTQNSLRKAVSYVPQEPLLFHRSIRENIAYGNPAANDEQVILAAKKANAHTFIKQLPNAYETTVGERGVKLSGGQRQRIAIARAILKNAPILVLDEATSALDSENETEVQKALWTLMKGRTVIVVAHRLSTIQRMDRIVVLDEGHIVETGPHKKLIASGGLYSKLWHHQSGGFIED